MGESLLQRASLRACYLGSGVVGESLLQRQSEGVLPGQRGSGRATSPETV